jgi:hypothetical protein
MRRAAALVAALAACVCASTARADGDPASDYLLGLQVFVPFDAKIPDAKQKEVFEVVRAANTAGYKIRAAIIWSSYDLGSVTALWHKPRQYARFLGAELRFVYKGRLLIVMPNGFGFFWNGKSVDREYAVLEKIPTGKSGIELVDAVEKAVVALAADDGIKVDARAGSGGESHSRQRLIILLATVAAILLAILLRLALRGRTLRKSA